MRFEVVLAAAAVFAAAFASGAYEMHFRRLNVERVAVVIITVGPFFDPQAAFEQAGGVESYFAMLDAMRAMGSARPAGAQQCPNLPVGP